MPVCFNPVEPWGSQEEFWAEGPCFPLKSFQRCVEDVYSFRVEFDGACFFAELSETGQLEALLSSPVLDVRLLTALQVLQVQDLVSSAIVRPMAATAV